MKTTRAIPTFVLAVLVIVVCGLYAVEVATNAETATALAVGYIAFLFTAVIVLRVLRHRG